MPRIVYSLLRGSWSRSPVYLCCVHCACVMCVCACTFGGGSTHSLCPWGPCAEGDAERTGWAGVCRLGEGRGTRKCPHRAGPSGEGDSAPLVDLVPSHFEKHSKRTNSDIHGRKCTAISNKEGTRTQYRLRRFRVKRGIKGRTYRNERGHLACGRSS